MPAVNLIDPLFWCSRRSRRPRRLTKGTTRCACGPTYVATVSQLRFLLMLTTTSFSTRPRVGCNTIGCSRPGFRNRARPHWPGRSGSHSRRKGRQPRFLRRERPGPHGVLGDMVPQLQRARARAPRRPEEVLVASSLRRGCRVGQSVTCQGEGVHRKALGSGTTSSSTPMARRPRRTTCPPLPMS